MKTHAFYADSPSDLEVVILDCQQNQFKPTLAILFSSIEKELEKICQLFDHYNIDLFGCTTAGEILNDQIYDTSIVGLFFDLEPDNYQLFLSTDPAQSTYEKAFMTGQFAHQTFENPAIIVASGGVAVNAQEIVDGLKAGLGREVPIFGGLAADDLQLKRTCVFSRKDISDNGLLSLVFDNTKISITGLAISGWEAIGGTHTVTKAVGNVIYTIDDEPALDVFIKYFGYFDNFDLKGKPVSTISAQYPLQVLRDDGSTVLRSPLIGDESEKTLTLAGGVKQGDQFRFSISPGFEVIDETVKAFGDYSQLVQEADALILFSCKGRHAALGPMIEDEVKGIYNHWKAPMIGFFSYGEIGATENSTCNFHNETCSLVVIKS